MTRLAEPATGAAAPELGAARPAGEPHVSASDRTEPLPRTAGTVNGAAAPPLATSPLLSEAQSLLDPVADAAQSLLGPLGDATQPLLGSLGDVVGTSAREAVSLSRHDLLGAAGDVPLWHAATSSQTTFAAPPAHGKRDAPGAGGSAPPSPAGTTAGAGSSGSAPFAPIGLLVLLALATPSLSRFLRTVPAFLRPTPFICALERPG